MAAETASWTVALSVWICAAAASTCTVEATEPTWSATFTRVVCAVFTGGAGGSAVGPGGAFAALAELFQRNPLDAVVPGVFAGCRQGVGRVRWTDAAYPAGKRR